MGGVNLKGGGSIYYPTLFVHAFITSSLPKIVGLLGVWPLGRTATATDEPADSFLVHQVCAPLTFNNGFENSRVMLGCFRAIVWYFYILFFLGRGGNVESEMP